jgi:hypothetical protein
MPACLAAIDHVLIGVRDLERARMGWERLGFTVTPRGRHLGWGTGNYCIMFPDDYLELLGIVDPRQFTNRLDEFLARREGAMGLAFATRSGAETAAELARRGLHPSEPRDLARQLELPEGTVLPRFRLVHLPPEDTPGLAAFVCQHLTPELIRRPAWLKHANGAVGLRGITVVVDETETLRQGYEKLFGADVNATDNLITVHCGRHRLTFVTADDFAVLYPDAELDPRVTLPAVAAITVATRDPALAADHLAQWQVEFAEGAGGTVIVPPAAANGVLLVFARG